MRSQLVTAAIAFTALASGIAAASLLRASPDPPAASQGRDYRSYFPPGLELEVSTQVNARLNIQMDLLENVEGVDRGRAIEVLRDTVLDDANDEQLRVYTLTIIGTLISDGDLSVEELKPLATTFLEVIHQTETPSTPKMRAAARASIIGTELFMFQEFLAAIDKVEADPEVIAYFLQFDIVPSWLKSEPREVGKPGNVEPSDAKTNPQPHQIVPTAEFEALEWRYTFEKPSDDARWTKPTFDDSKWGTGKAGFGTTNTPSAKIGTEWIAESIWLRHHFKIDSLPEHPLRLRFHHNDDAEVFINGVRIVELKGRTKWYKEIEFPKEAREALVKGENVLAVTCRNLGGPQYIDVGMIEVVPAPKEEAKEAGSQDEKPTSDKDKSGSAKGDSPGAPKGN